MKCSKLENFSTSRLAILAQGKNRFGFSTLYYFTLTTRFLPGINLCALENHGKTVFVMNTEGLHLAGVSGGVSLELKSEHRNTEYLICTFSNPLVGCVKASVFLSSEGGIDQIDALWEPMDQCSLEKGTFYGIYRESDKHITFVWKDQKTPW